MRVVPSADLRPGIPELGNARSLLVIFAGAVEIDGLVASQVSVTCVDHDRSTIAAMIEALPSHWCFVRKDAFAYLELASAWALRWDAVVVDPPADLRDECVQRLEVWCELARRAVVLATDGTAMIVPPSGWAVTDTHQRPDRSGEIQWTVLRR